jgi:hypothetical protein
MSISLNSNNLLLQQPACSHPKTDRRSWQATAITASKIALIAIAGLAVVVLGLALFKGATLATYGIFPAALLALTSASPWIKTAILTGAIAAFGCLFRWVCNDLNASAQATESTSQIIEQKVSPQAKESTSQMIKRTIEQLQSKDITNYVTSKRIDKKHLQEGGCNGYLSKEEFIEIGTHSDNTELEQMISESKAAIRTISTGEDCPDKNKAYAILAALTTQAWLNYSKTLPTFQKTQSINSSLPIMLNDIIQPTEAYMDRQEYLASVFTLVQSHLSPENDESITTWLQLALNMLSCRMAMQKNIHTLRHSEGPTTVKADLDTVKRDLGTTSATSSTRRITFIDKDAGYEKDYYLSAEGDVDILFEQLKHDISQSVKKEDADRLMTLLSQAGAGSLERHVGIRFCDGQETLFGAYSHAALTVERGKPATIGHILIKEIKQNPTLSTKSFQGLKSGGTYYITKMECNLEDTSFVTKGRFLADKEVEEMIATDDQRISIRTKQIKLRRDMIADLSRIYSDSAKTQLIINETPYYVSQGDDIETASQLFDTLLEQLSALVGPKDVWEIIDQLHQGGMAPLIEHSTGKCGTLGNTVWEGDRYIIKLIIDTKKDICIKKSLIQEIEEDAELRQAKGYTYKSRTPFTLATYSDTSPSQFLCLSSTWSLKNKEPAIDHRFLSDEEVDKIRTADNALILLRITKDPRLEYEREDTEEHTDPEPPYADV